MPTGHPEWCGGKVDSGSGVGAGSRLSCPLCWWGCGGISVLLILTGQARLTVQPHFQFTMQSVRWCVLLHAVKLVGHAYFHHQRC